MAIEHHEGEQPEGIDAFKQFEHGNIVKIEPCRIFLVQFQQCRRVQTVRKRQYLLVFLFHDVQSPFEVGIPALKEMTIKENK